MSFKLENNEHIMLIARRHWFVTLSQTIGLGFTLLVPIFVSSVAHALPFEITQYGNLGLLSVILLVAWFFLAWNVAFIIWTNHYLDVLVVTNLHVIDIEQIGLWRRDIAVLNIDKIQDISTKTDGLMASTFDYGDVEIQTAGSITQFIVKEVERPDRIRNVINEQINKRLNPPNGPVV